MIANVTVFHPRDFFFLISGFFIFKLLGWNPCVLCISIIFGELVMPQALSMILLMPSPAHYSQEGQIQQTTV